MRTVFVTILGIISMIYGWLTQNRGAVFLGFMFVFLDNTPFPGGGDHEEDFSDGKELFGKQSLETEKKKKLFLG